MSSKRLNVKVVPRSSKNKVQLLEDGSLKVHLTAAPVEGKANEALIPLLAEYFKVKKSKVSLLVGKNSKNKIVQID
ncbi:MAG: DUF167 domain-containing protein [Deltaproteobacteria bacterium]|nr:DUF167 domain-containing protein [Deltaproteobacteria bacterium]